MTHTPGPWKEGDLLTRHGNEDIEFYYITGSDKRTVAEVGLWKDKKEEQAANARLIAVAPDLLKACKDLMIVLALKSDGIVEGHELRARDQARAAIAKAEGGDA